MQKILIGIDPDLIANGVAITNNGKVTELCLMKLPQMIERIQHYAQWASCEDNYLMVYIEAGWLNQNVNHHSSAHKKRAKEMGLKKGLTGKPLENYIINYTLKVGQRTSSNVGENHATGKIIEQFVQFYAIPYQLIKPTTKKFDADLFKKVTGYTERTNQEQRDALMLIWGR